ncbi:hypothetical protein ACHAWF_010739 [Thalassiosira exigua]
MRKHPIADLVGELKQLGADAGCVEELGSPPVTIDVSGLTGGEAKISGEMSSHFLSSLLMTTPLIDGDVKITIKDELISAPYLRQRSVVTFLVVVAVAVYAQWEHGVLLKLLQDFLNQYHPLYYDGTSMVFEGGGVPSPPSSSSDRSLQEQTFYAVYPHGAFCIGWALLYHSLVLRGVRFCFAPTLHTSLVFRLYARMVNRPGSAARLAMNACPRAGDGVALPLGGFKEHCIAIWPVYVFGEGRLFANVQGMWKARLVLNRLGVPTILVWWRWFFSLLPRKAELLVVVRRPLVLPKVDAPTKKEVACWHRRYMDELKKSYEEYKEVTYGPEEGKDAKLEVW